MSGHEYLTVGNRRWCRHCNTFQRLRSGVWRDDPTMLGPWPGFSKTEERCPKGETAETAGWGWKGEQNQQGAFPW